MEDKINDLGMTPPMPIKPILDMLAITMTDMEKRINKLETFIIWSMQEKGLDIAKINKILDR